MPPGANNHNSTVHLFTNGRRSSTTDGHTFQGCLNIDTKAPLVTDNIQAYHNGVSRPYYHPVIREFQELIERDPELYMAFHEMFEQVPSEPPYDKDPTGKPQIRDYLAMLDLFNLVIHEAPPFQEDIFVGFPINAALNWPMGTPAGFRAFTHPKLNAMFTKMFDVWSTFLASPASRAVLTDAPGGWFSPAAMRAMPNFAETFVCAPSLPYHGFQSWDDFFTRGFRPGIRPVERPDDNSAVNSACESAVYRIAHNIRKRDQFWLKNAPYSLFHMLNDDPLAERFVGGSIWQAYLSALDYHRWASPVNGRVVKTVNIPGTYYAASPAMGFANTEDGLDPAACCRSQAFITSVAARAAIFIEADNPAIGLMCFLAVGMAEVSTCEVTVRPGNVVKKGEELGMFHFGGSTHCLIFRPETKIRFLEDLPPETHVSLNTVIAVVET